MNIHSAYTTLLRKEDLTTPVRAIIDSVMVQNVGTDEKPDMKPVLHFRGTLKPAKLNKTNAQMISEVWGAETDGWVGRTIELFNDPTVEFAKKKVGGIGFRIPGAGNAPVTGAPACWGIMQAAAECEKVGISRSELGAYLRANQIDPYHGEKHTALVQAFIASRTAVGESLDALAAPPKMSSEEIPFSWALPLLLSAASLMGMA